MLTVESWPVDRLLPYAANARIHPDDQVAQLVDSIRRFGFNQPCLVDDQGVLIAGHGRLLAARELGLGQVPVIRLGHLSPDQARAFRLADNRIAQNSEWDEELLAQELAALQGSFDLELMGFGEDELRELLEPETGEGLTGEDEAPEPLAVAAARLGDVWLLGPHRVVWRRLHRPGRCGGLFGAGKASPDGYGPAVWGGLRPQLAE